MNWKECLWEWFIREMITECTSAIIKWIIWFLIRLITEKILQSKEKNYKELTMKKVKVNEKNQPIVSKGRGSRNPEKGYVRTHGFSCHDEYWLEITEEAYSRNLSVGQYLTLAHRLYMNANQKEKVFDTKKDS